MTKSLITKSLVPYFTDAELILLNTYIDDGGANIAPSTAVNFYTLYAEGRAIEQIHQSFPQWPVGALLYARYYYEWDKLKKEGFNNLVGQVRDRLVKSQLEVANHLMDKLTIANREFAQEMEEYMQNPDPKKLPGNRIKSSMEYKTVLTALQETIKFFKDTTSATVPTQPQVAGQIGNPNSLTININTNKPAEITTTTMPVIDVPVEEQKAIEAPKETPKSPWSAEERLAILKELRNKK